ncbi:MAG TPA: magnesium-translocating P-type ATPase [bacterium]|jgi:Mg2+-importing ATPase|nr:magnesium-translocating P-type ATPase [bacterium]
MKVLFKGNSLFSKLSLPVAFKSAGADPSAHAFGDFYRDVAGADAERALRLVRGEKLGLSTEEAARRLSRSGPNEVAHERKDGALKQLWGAAKTPFNLLLVVLSGVSFATGDPTSGCIMGAMVVVAVTLTFFQEYRSNQAAERLQAMVTTTVSVLRREEMEFGIGQRLEKITRSEKREVPLKELVPGDLVQLSAGDMIPADLRVLSAKDLFISQSALTGESFPSEKLAGPATGTGAVIELNNLCFMGSNVLSGSAQAVVVKTGQDTYFGSLAKTLMGKREVTSFEKGVNNFTILMFTFMAVMVPAVFLINGFVKHSWPEAFLFAVAVAVGLTPEMLPMIVTVNLAKGALAMSRKKVIVKRLNSIQNFGAMDVLCTDKTGTLTADKVVLLRYVDPTGFKSPKVLRYGYLNSYYQTGLKNLLDIAVLDQKQVASELKVDVDYNKVDEIPFDFQRRRMSVVVKEQGRNDVLITKGALEEVFAVCDRVDGEGDVEPLDEELRQTYSRVARDLNDDGLRVIAVAYKVMPTGHPAYGVADESGMILLGYLAFLDPPKESAEKAIELLRGHGVDVKVLTGDNDHVTRHICSEVGIPVDRILLGGEVEKMSDEELDPLVLSLSVFAKLSPAQKERIIRSLHRSNKVVGFMGDGINDAPALKAADVGISVDNAVDIAKESADIILLEKSLLVLEEGVLEGRKVFGNIIKYIKMGASSNFGNMFSMLGASIIFPFFPMLPTQILVQNLLYDFSQTTIPFDDVDPDYLARPRRWEIGGIRDFMIYIGPISSIFDYTTFGLMWWIFKVGEVQALLPKGVDVASLKDADPVKIAVLHAQSLFQSAWFVEGLLTQTFIVHMIRTAKIPFFQSRASAALMTSTAIIMGLGILIPYTALGAKIGMVPLPLSFYPWLIATMLGYAVLTQGVKTWFIRKYGFD